MREIKFRAWDKIEKRMYYDVQDTYDFRCNGKGCLEESFGDVLKNDKYIVLQYVGMEDINGREIYEGDIVTLKGEVFEIKYKDYKYIADGFYDSSQDVPDDFFSEYAYSFFEIVGNIYENPELLEAK